MPDRAAVQDVLGFLIRQRDLVEAWSKGDLAPPRWKATGEVAASVPREDAWRVVAALDRAILVLDDLAEGRLWRVLDGEARREAV